MKKNYNKPKLVLIGDMMHNTLGASGTGTDNGSFQAGGTGTQSNNNGFNNQDFNNNGLNG